MKRVYDKNAAVQAFLSDYDYDDIAAVVYDTNSTRLWGISPPSLQNLIEKLHGNGSLSLRLKMDFFRISHEYQSGTEFTQIFDFANKLTIRNDLVKMLHSMNTSQELPMGALLPKFLKVRMLEQLRFIK